MSRGGLRSTSFKPGVSGNPGGRPKKATTVEARRVFADVKSLARSVAPEAVQALVCIMNDPKSPPAARVGAATAILDRGYGRPAQAVEITVAAVLEKLDFAKLSDQELEQLERLLEVADGTGTEEQRLNS